MAVKQILGKVTVTPKGEYSSGETYKRLDIVTSNGQSYIAKVDNTGVNVTNTNTWLQLVEKPEKGIDYFTEEDIAQLVSMVTDDSESEFNEYYNGKVSDFNSNASSKTSEFNSNYDEKVESFNTIFDTSTDDFDGNYETKLSAFNENASTQTSTFNSVVEQATSDFNSNASTLTETFNTNASEKTSAFNINASEKTQEFNDNVDEKTEQITTQLDNYVQFDNYPSNEKAGVVKSHINGFQVSNDGNPNAAILSKEQYDTIENQYFISKGTLENIKDYYVESSTPVKNLNTSLKDLTPKQNAEGTDNTFDDGLESPLFTLGGDGKSEQVITQGYQLVDWENNFSKSTGVSFSFINDILIVNGVSGTVYQSVTYNITDVVKNNPGKTIKYSDYKHSITNNDTNSVAQIAVRYSDETPILYRVVCNYNTNQLSSYVVPSDTSNINRVDLSIFTNNSDNTNIDNTITIEKPLLYFDNNNIYEPYTGGQPSPSPDYPQEINSIEGSVEFDCRGKNLLKPLLLDNDILNGITSNTLDDGSISLNGTSTSDTYRSIATTSLKANTDYTLSVDSDTTNDIQIFCNTTPTESGTNWIPINNKYTIFRVNNDIQNAIINIFIRNNTTVNKVFKVQLEQGTQATSYEQYVQPNEVTFNLGQEKLRSVGDVKDELVVDLSTGDYYKVENVGEVVLNGSEEYTNNNRNFFTLLKDINIKWKELYERPEIMCNQYISSRNDDINEKDYAISQYIPTALYNYNKIVIHNIDYNNDVSLFKEYLSANNVIANYQLATTTTKKLGTLSAENLAKLKTFKGYNNVTVNTNLGLMNIRFTYGLDIKKYVDNKIAELSAQLIKGE